MQFAQQRDALRHQKFHFRKSLSTSLTRRWKRQNRTVAFVLAQTPDTPSISSIDKNRSLNADDSSEYRLMTINEIINGSVSQEFFSLSWWTPFALRRTNLLAFWILSRIICRISKSMQILDARLTNIWIWLVNAQRVRWSDYFIFFSRSTIVFLLTGSLLTNATWMRHFVANHPAYKQDSVVSDEIAYDLLWKMTRISHFDEPCPEVLPRASSKTTLDISAAVEKDHNELEVKRSLMQHNNQNEETVDST